MRLHQYQRHGPRRIWSVIAIILAIILALLPNLCAASHDKQSHWKQGTSTSSLPSVTSAAAKSSSSLSPVTATATTSITSSTTSPTPVPCDPLPLSRPPRQLCDHIAANCPSSGRLDYLYFFYCSSLGTHDRHSGDGGGQEDQPLTPGLTLQRVLAIICIAVWIMFLFSCLGLVASDFFCPNLGTLSSRLGMNETTAGVTFLALGNGSPDVFSTFAAMSSGSGQLAIGELIGAASFIVSVVAGSMMLIKPFKVRPYPFLRDVGFFTVGVAATMYYLIDGKLTLGECLAMVGLYLLYATTVIVGSLWEERRRRQKVLWEQARSAYLDSSDEDDPMVHGDGPTTPPSRAPSSRTHTPPNGTLLALETGRQAHSLLSPEYQPDPSDADRDPFEIWGAGDQTRGRDSERSDLRRAGRNLSTGDLEASPRITSSLSGSRTHDSGAGGQPAHLLVRTHSKLRGTSGTVGTLMPRHSLLGAIEFRDVVRSLETADGRERRSPSTDGRGGAVDVWDLVSSRDPEQYLPHRHNHRQGGHQRTPSLESGMAASMAVATVSVAGPSVSPSLSPSSRPLIPRSASDMPNTGAASKGQQPLLISAGGIVDPWKEHGAGDGCDDAGTQRSSSGLPALPRLQIPQQSVSITNPQGPSTIPSIVIVPDQDEGEGPRSPMPLPLFDSLVRMLFPSLRHWKSKSILGCFLSVLNTPPLVVLTLTLPVVDDESDARAAANALGGDVGAGGALQLKGGERDLFARSVQTAAEGADPGARDTESILDLATGERQVPERDPWKEEEERQIAANKKRDLEVAEALRKAPAHLGSPMHLGGSNQQAHVEDDDASSLCSSISAASSHYTPLSADAHLVISICQCFFAPPFLAWAVLPDCPLRWLLYSLLFSSCLALSVTLIALQARRSGGFWYATPTLAFLSLSRCFIGFCVSIAWISTVVNEVVAILQALGLICGLSDAILGLTIFAAGNSLADLVADVTIARAGYPIMAISACFAGPLLNLLLGIGLSGTYILSSPSNFDSSRPVYHIEISPTLLSSGAGLLLVLIGTLIVAPLNGFQMGKKMGWGLIAAYSVVMAVNLAVEISGYGRRR